MEGQDLQWTAAAHPNGHAVHRGIALPSAQLIPSHVGLTPILLLQDTTYRSLLSWFATGVAASLDGQQGLAAVCVMLIKHGLQLVCMEGLTTRAVELLVPAVSCVDGRGGLVCLGLALRWNPRATGTSSHANRSFKW